MKVSSRYGLLIYRIYQAGFNLAALGKEGDKEELKRWIGQYDAAWTEYKALPNRNRYCATLYSDKGFGFDPDKGAFSQPGIGDMVDGLRDKAAK